jgi:hypothetical protein
MALESPRISADVVEIGEFPRLAERHRVRAVPMIVLDESVSFVGALDESTLIAQIVRLAQGKPLQPADSTWESSPIEQRAPEQRAPERRESGIILP